MRKAPIILLIGLALLYATSCRTVKRSRSVADSSSVRTEASAERWAREIVTEYVPTSGLSLPSITVPEWWPGLQFVHLPGSVLPGDSVRVPVPGRERTRIIRQTVRESGEKQAAKTEERQSAVRQKATSRGWSPIQERALLLVSWALLIAAVGLVLLGIARLVSRGSPPGR